RYRKVITIPLTTFDAAPHLHSYDDSPIRWTNGTSNSSRSSKSRNSFDHLRGAKTFTIEGGTSTLDTTSIGGGVNDLRLVITAQPSDTIERNYDQLTNRGGGGGGGGAVIGSASPQSPTTPAANPTTPTLVPGKTLLNTSPNLLPIITATDTFNNLKNLVKIDSSSNSGNGKGNGTPNSSNYRGGGGANSNKSGIGAPRGAVTAVGSGPVSGGTVGGPSGHYSSGYNKNSAKIRQHDSELSPRPRRTYPNDSSSSSSRYYNKNSDLLGAAGNNNLNNHIGGIDSSTSSYNGGLQRGRNSYHNSSDGATGGYQRGLSSNSSSAGSGNYRSQQQRYELVNGNGHGHRHYNNSNGSSSSSNNNNHQSNAGKPNYGLSGGRYRDDYNQRDNYRDRDSYADDNNSSPVHQRYNQSTGGGGAATAGGSLERNGYGGGGVGSGGRYQQPNTGRQTDYERRSQVGSAPPQAVAVKSVTPPPATATPGGGSSAPVPTATITGRWIPPSLRPQHGLTQSEKNDAVFRRVRGILNKLTPEKFQELSDELLKLDLNSIVILNGVILLIFDKALDEPKYSSMYAQLCKRLSEEAPSFEQDPNNSCTFLRLLIAVCRDKFNNRLKRDEAHDNRPPPENEADEEERRHLAKQRMLGNVKFIGELNKLDMLSKNVLHACIMELLDKKKKRTAGAQEMCEDMECLAQLLKTCGKNLDSEQGKELMNQYFETLERRSKSTEYPPRIRFMLKDVIELRQNTWIPRKVGGTSEGPVPIKQIRSDDDSIIRTPFANRQRDMRNNDRDGDNWMSRLGSHLGYNDVFSGLSVTGASPIVSPFATSANNRDRDRDNRSYNQRDRQRDQGSGNTVGNGGNVGNYNNRYNKHNNQNGGSGSHREDSRGGSHRNNDRNAMDDTRGGGGGGQYGSGNNGGSSNTLLLGSKELAPRFKRNLMSTNQDAVENLQMRPAANSLLFRAASQNQKMPTQLPISTPPNGNNSMGQAVSTAAQLSNSHYPLLGTPTSHLMQQTTRPASTPSAEYDTRSLQGNQQQPQYTEKSLKSTSSSPNFGTVMAAEEKKSTESGGNKEQQKIDGGERPTTPIGGKQEKKKDKGPNKEELSKKASAYFKDKFYFDEEQSKNEEQEFPKQNEEQSVSSDAELESKLEDAFTTLVNGFLELKLPEKSLKDVCLQLLMEVLDRMNDVYLERVVRFLQTLRKQSSIKPNVIVEIFKQLVNKMNEREALNNRITTLVASVLSKAVVCEPPLIKLNDIANYTDNGQHYPLFLLVLQQLHKSIGKALLEEKFRASKVELMNSLPEVDRNKERLAAILEDRQLSFLYPLLKVQAEMLKQLQSDPNPNNFYKWIKANVDNKYYKDPGFIQALMTVVVKYITKETTLASNMDTKEHPEKSITQREQAMLETYSQMLQTFLGQNELQLMALYALQLFCYSENFPKGMLCRWFKYLYDSEIIEEEAFVLWKEEISDKYPGKGSALFQVNAWLTWLQEAESEDDED
ncbi:NAT1, partial [Drosophila busckii]